MRIILKRETEGGTGAVVHPLPRTFRVSSGRSWNRRFCSYSKLRRMRWLVLCLGCLRQDRSETRPMIFQGLGRSRGRRLWAAPSIISDGTLDCRDCLKGDTMSVTSCYPHRDSSMSLDVCRKQRNPAFRSAGAAIHGRDAGLDFIISFLYVSWINCVQYS